MLQMKTLLSTCLLLMAFFLFAAGVFEMSGMMGPTSLPWAITLSLCAQLLVLASAYAAVPRAGTTGFFRAAAFVFYCVESAGVMVALFSLFYKWLDGTELLGSGWLTWTLAESSCALALLLFSAKAWHLFDKSLRQVASDKRT